MWNQAKYFRDKYHNDPIFRKKCIDNAMKFSAEHPNATRKIRQRYYKKNRVRLIAHSIAYHKKHKLKYKRRWKKKYNSDKNFKNKVKQGVSIWREENRQYYNFYRRMEEQGIKVNKKDFDKGAYFELYKPS